MFTPIKNAIQRWQISLIALSIVKTPNGTINPTITQRQISFLGMIQAYKAKELNIMSSDQANIQFAFGYFQVHTLNLNLNLKTTDFIVYQNKQYIIKSINDFSQWGYFEYIIVQKNQ